MTDNKTTAIITMSLNPNSIGVINNTTSEIAQITEYSKEDLVR